MVWMRLYLAPITGHPSPMPRQWCHFKYGISMYKKFDASKDARAKARVLAETTSADHVAVSTAKVGA